MWKVIQKQSGSLRLIIGSKQMGLADTSGASMNQQRDQEVTLDHVGLLVPNLEKAAGDFAALGFTLTPRAAHLNGEGEPAGSEQCSIMLREGYIELQEITGPRGSHLMSRAQEKHFGLHIVAFGVTDARDCARAITGLPLSDVMDWARPVVRSGVDGIARFSFFVADYDPADEALLCWTQHLTPEIMRDDAVLNHKNGADIMRGFHIFCPEEATAAMSKRMVLAGGVSCGNAVNLGHAHIGIGPGDLPREKWPAVPFCSDLHLTAMNLKEIERAARDRDFSVDFLGDTLRIDMMDAYGIRLLLDPIGPRT
ncbi:catechol 2,3-dioxygenase-like lactoylglutathione lyase family enzyme [Sulfitobacter geojensis]|nr:catechol 2,3-dioxygenase-like lactoylglutathione lyase family enzyme [Sulfitobacter geojensis]